MSSWAVVQFHAVVDLWISACLFFLASMNLPPLFLARIVKHLKRLLFKFYPAFLGFLREENFFLTEGYLIFIWTEMEVQKLSMQII